MKTLSFTICLVLAGTFAFAQKTVEKYPSLVARLAIPPQKPVKKINSAYYRIERIPHHLADKDGIETRNAEVSSPAVVINEIKAFPNPFSEQVDIFITDGHMDKSVYKTELFDVEGRKVHSETLFLNQTSLQLSHLGKGVYILYIEKNGKNIKQQKLVKE